MPELVSKLSGTDRIIPLNKRAFEILKFWSEQFPKREPEHYAFPAERYGGAGDAFEGLVVLGLVDGYRCRD